MILAQIRHMTKDIVLRSGSWHCSRFYHKNAFQREMADEAYKLTRA
jgi:hypothetical protein